MLLFGIHLHQPPDNLREAVYRAFELCYIPLFETLKKYPEFKFSLHVSGWLFEEIKNRYKEVFANIKYLHDIGSLELLSGGFYEPILVSIPQEDAVFQIRKLNDFLIGNFGSIPRGLWLAERVWDDSVIPILSKCGIEYVIVDDYHFICAGFEKDELDGYFLSENNGDVVKIFPIDKDLRYAIPFRNVDETLGMLEKRDVNIVFDDGEKFGLWPDTYDWVYKKGWLEEFLEKLLERGIETKTFGEFLSENKPKGLCYLPNCSYIEMTKWALRPEDALEYDRLINTLGHDYFEDKGKRLIKGTTWKNFFLKYHESNYIHKRMLELSKKSKSDALFRLQSNDVYWHGIFGGLYLANLRDNAYRYICECEDEHDRVEIKDIDLDGTDEVKVVKNGLLYVFKEGNLVEFDDLKRRFNFQNTLMRRKEHYHFKLNAKENNGKGVKTIHEKGYIIDERMKDRLIFDTYPKYSFIDHLESDFTLEDFKYSRLKREILKLKSVNPLVFEGDCLRKEFRFESGLEFLVEVSSDKRYAIEFNLHFAHIDKVLFNDKFFKDDLTFVGKSLRIIDDFTERELVIEMESVCDMWLVRLDTVNITESGFEIINQGVGILFMPNNNREIRGYLCLK